MLSEKQAAACLLIERWTLGNWRGRGIGPNYVKLGERVAYKASDIAAFIEAHYVVTTGRKPHEYHRSTARIVSQNRSNKKLQAERAAARTAAATAPSEPS